MSPVTGTIQFATGSTWQPSVSSARRAAERAMRAAAVAVSWAERSGAGQAEAAEALRAGECARFAADRAEQAASHDEMLGHVRAAEAAARAALEADRKVSAVIDASLWAEADRRLAPRSPARFESAA